MDVCIEVLVEVVTARDIMPISRHCDQLVISGGQDNSKDGNFMSLSSGLRQFNTIHESTCGSVQRNGIVSFALKRLRTYHSSDNVAEGRRDENGATESE